MHLSHIVESAQTPKMHLHLPLLASLLLLPLTNACMRTNNGAEWNSNVAILSLDLYDDGQLVCRYIQRWGGDRRVYLSCSNPQHRAYIERVNGKFEVGFERPGFNGKFDLNTRKQGGTYIFSAAVWGC